VITVQLKIVQASSEDVAHLVDEVALGHGQVSTEDAQAGVLFVSAGSSADNLLVARAQIDELARKDLPVFGVSLDPVSELRDVVASMPHEGDWIEAKSHDEQAISDAVAEAERRAAIETDADARRGRKGLASRIRSLRSSQASVTPSTEAPTGGVSVFVSYSRKDKLASDVVEELRRHGHEVWIDTAAIKGADDWRASIERGIASSAVFVLLMSPNVVKNPRHVSQELQFASHENKRIIPVYLRPTPALPDGLGLPLLGTQWISLKPDFQQGIGRLLETIGTPERSHVRTLREKAGAARATVRRVAHEQELGKKAKKYGSAALAGGLLVGAVAVKILLEQEEQAQRQREQEEIRSREEYKDRTLRLLQQAQQELSRAELGSEAGMDARSFREEFVPRFQKTIGALTAIKPADLDLRDKHDRMIESLEEVASDFGRAYQAIERDDEAAYLRSINKIRVSAANSVQAHIEWIVNILV
jgi:TIR domain